VGGLTPSQLDQVDWLRRLCETAGGTDLKLTPRETDGGPVAAQFLAEVDGGVVGYCGVDIGLDAEVCGMVHPEHRRQGIGTTLLRQALRATRTLGRESALVICEEAEPLAIEWLARLGGVIHSSEQRMVLHLGDEPAVEATAGTTIQLRRSRPADREALVRLLTDGFPQMTLELTEQMVARHQVPDQESLLAWEGDTVVGTMRLIHAGERWMIYGVVVESARRGRGIGGAAMRVALQILRSRGADEVSLEVEPDNVPAVRLYQQLGFRTSTTYRYVRVPAT
jgi:mycothiol synthase